MVYHYDYMRPQEVTVAVDLGRKKCTVNFDITELPENDPTGFRYSWRSVTLEPGVWSYDSIVSAIIYLEYNPNQIEALNANMVGALSGILTEGITKLSEYKEEFMTFTKWRLHAKAIAREIITKYPKP